MSEFKKDISWRILLIYLGVVGLAVLIIYNIIRIQNSAEFSDIEEQKKVSTRIVDIDPFRGTIYASNGEILVQSDAIFNPRWDSSLCTDEEFEEAVDSMALILNQTFPEKTKSEWKSYLRKNKEQNKRYIKIKNNVNRRDLQKILKAPIFRLPRNKGGFMPEAKETRKLHYSQLAKRTIGYDKGEGKRVGIEGAYSRELSGKKGKRLLKKSGSKWIPASSSYIEEPVNGYDLITTIDVEIQNVAQQELLNQLQSESAAMGCVIVMEVETGYIKAISNLRKAGDGNYYEVYNQAIGVKTQPGSTFKLASLIVGLEDGAFDIDDIVETSPGYVRFYDRDFRDTRDYGTLNIKEAFAHSSNVAFTKIINENYGNNPKKFIQGLKRLGLDNKTGIALAGESTPYISEPGKPGWSGVSIPSLSIGYESEFSPIQMLSLYNAIANGGKRMKPQLVSEIRENGKVIKNFDPIATQNQICSYRTLKKVQSCLEAVVSNDGTGKALQAANFSIAGKTGTARMAKGSAGYGQNGEMKYQASFAGYFPADKPKYSCIVVIQAPENNIYGAKVSGTVFKAIADKIYNSDISYHKAINLADNETPFHAPVVKAGNKKETKKVLGSIDESFKVKDADPSSQWIAAEVYPQEITLQKRFIGNTTMPNVSGMGLKDAIYILENAGLIVAFKGSGKVKSQSIKPGVAISRGQTVTLSLGK